MVLGETVWTPIEKAEEVKALVEGKPVLMYGSRTQLHRQDGNMVKHFEENDAYMVRKWTIDENARLCWMIFTKPEHVIDCAHIEMSQTDPVKYRFSWSNTTTKP